MMIMMSRIERALRMVRMDLVQLAGQDWNEVQAEQVAQTLVACLRPERDAPRDNALVRDPRLSRDVLRRALRYVNDNLDSQLTWEDIASAVGLDAYKFGRGFKLSTGMTPHQYVIRCRVRRAIKLLAREELSIVEIAFEVGCSPRRRRGALRCVRRAIAYGVFVWPLDARMQLPVSSCSSRTSHV